MNINHILDSNLTENNHAECSYSKKKYNLMISDGTRRCRKVRWIRRYHVLNKLLFPPKFAHHVLILFYPFSNEKKLVSGFAPMYRKKLLEKRVQDVININEMKFQSYGDLNFCTSKFHAANTTRWWNRRTYKFLKFKTKGSLQCVFIHGPKIM